MNYTVSKYIEVNNFTKNFRKFLHNHAGICIPGVQIHAACSNLECATALEDFVILWRIAVLILETDGISLKIFRLCEMEHYGVKIPCILTHSCADFIPEHLKHASGTRRMPTLGTHQQNYFGIESQ